MILCICFICCKCTNSLHPVHLKATAFISRHHWVKKHTAKILPFYFIYLLVFICSVNDRKDICSTVSQTQQVDSFISAYIESQTVVAVINKRYLSHDFWGQSIIYCHDWHSIKHWYSTVNSIQYTVLSLCWNLFWALSVSISSETT